MVEFFKDNEKRNLFFSALALGMTLAITIVALSCSFFMVFAADIQGFAGFGTSSETLYFTTLNFRLVQNPSGLYDAISTDGAFGFTGTVNNSSGGVNTAGARTSQPISYEFEGEAVTYYVIRDLVWADQVTDNDSILEFDNENYNNGINSLFSDAYKQYASNFNDIPDYNNALLDDLKVYFTSANSSSANLCISAPEDSGFVSADITVYSHALYYLSDPLKYGNSYNNSFFGNLKDSSTGSVSHEAISKKAIQSNVTENIQMIASSLSPNQAVSLFHSGSPTLVGGTRPCMSVVDSGIKHTYQYSGGDFNQSFAFNQSTFIEGVKDINRNTQNPVAPAYYTCNQSAFMYSVEVVLKDSTGKSSPPVYCYYNILSGDFKGIDNTGNNLNNSSSTSYLNDNGEGQLIPVSSVDYNNQGLGNLSNDTITDYINSGLGFKGPNGFIMTLEKSLSFIPQELWDLIFAALALSLILMIVKVLRGM